MIDTHCHLNFDSFDENLYDVIERAKEIGVKNIIIPGTDLENSKKAVEIANNNRGVYAAIGIHPTENLEKINLQKALHNMEELIEENKSIVAVGEIGLDYYKNKSAARLQKEFLVEQIKLAKKHDLSVIIHSRQASKDLLELLSSLWDDSLTQKVVLHACEARNELLQFAIKNRLYISIGGDITYDKEKEKFIREVPLELLLLETDSPLRTPRPLKVEGKYNNEPRNLKLILEHLSKLLNISKDDLEISTDSNAKLFFGI